ncbi:TPA: hypothetical protein I7717_01585 [Vibrio vulnificus]|nr:hypothetical protein VVMO6_03684 [Vibrio vulnificus MO6-24/O]PNM99363.1 hypothetical protein AL547_002640 [Vibrio vulnificus]POB52195.1 hypothetical protein CRN26_18125 [Vibrio vulnificus]HAS8143453.1 hypothetical protein [Vibrio vulnificus]HAS8220632.1 hypothetical protein [Vibrio vulnificus]
MPASTKGKKQFSGYSLARQRVTGSLALISRWVLISQRDKLAKMQSDLQQKGEPIGSPLLFQLLQNYSS